MNEMSLEEQIRCMQDMRNKLADFCALMNSAMEGFHDDILYLRSQGFSVENADTYQSLYYTPAKETVDEVIHHIYNYHFDYIDRVLEYLQAALNER